MVGTRAEAEVEGECDETEREKRRLEAPWIVQRCETGNCMANLTIAFHVLVVPQWSTSASKATNTLTKTHARGNFDPLLERKRDLLA